MTNSVEQLQTLFKTINNFNEKLEEEKKDKVLKLMQEEFSNSKSKEIVTKKPQRPLEANQ